ncbi:hypothetical protein [Sphingomonas nostoxanthinifaciens]|uniref:hypothetical protein n=1 Tax=Sphingomonas nostoxanthinifaciens TaxID=2872652 RepID=UPI001CC214C6|nr:hypothetical protein [Sphingomonas nostoxanthinifaciens]UAK24589.1 hypothetical protein K8P63_20200 [Sphingomonas nostoxanthinifaciens]
MTDQTPPPGPIPPAAQSPFPPHPAPKAHGEAPLPEKPAPAPTLVPGIGTFGFTLLGGALAAAIGVIVVRPLLKRRAKPAAKRKAPRRKPAAK